MSSTEASSKRNHAFWADKIGSKNLPFEIRMFSDIKGPEGWYHTFKFAAIKLLSVGIHNTEELTKLCEFKFEYDNKPIFASE